MKRVAHVGSRAIWIVFCCLGFGCGGDSTAPASSNKITVATQTEGFQIDADGYNVQVGAGSPTALGVNASTTLSGVSAGAVTVTLSGLAPNCAVNGANPVTVQVQAGVTATTTFHVVCTATPGGSYRIALMTNRDPAQSDGSWDLNVMNSDGSIAALTSPNGFLDAYPTWSPDGKKVAFASKRDGPLNIYVMN
ncbi:MAG TPA: hypothetical protein VE110_02655, partial [Gemmatimonadaceae bacterium]|nr:hypothetical protein [Gemmatimonadaceae bacterium]